MTKELRDAATRVRTFLDARATTRGLDPEVLLGFDLHELRTSDLRLLLAAVDEPTWPATPADGKAHPRECDICGGDHYSFQCRGAAA